MASAFMNLQDFIKLWTPPCSLSSAPAFLPLEWALSGLRATGSQLGDTRMRLRAVGARGTTAVISSLAVATLALSASPASAKMSDGYVRGYDVFRGDWSDEGVFGFRLNSVSNAVCLWQAILWAEGATEENGSAFDRSDIDGHFGTNTQYATKKLQVDWGLADNFGEADGRVGGNTFGKADDYLVKSGGSEERGDTLFLTYNAGSGRLFDLYRNSSGIYWFEVVRDSGTWRGASYTSVTSCD